MDGRNRRTLPVHVVGRHSPVVAGGADTAVEAVSVHHVVLEEVAAHRGEQSRETRRAPA